MIENLKNEIKNLLAIQKSCLSTGNYIELNKVNEKIFCLREKIRREKKLIAEIKNEKNFITIEKRFA